MSFNVLALITVAGRQLLPKPWSLAYSFFHRQERFLIQTSETKNGCRYGFFVPDGSGFLRVLTTSSYAYEINYVLNGCGSQSNVVRPIVTAVTC
jgi:hypothetical protein